MAPLAAIGKARAIELVKAGAIPFDFGEPHPKVAIVKQDGVFRIRALLVDPEVADKARDAAIAADGMWMPEMYFDLGQPTGEIYVEAATLAALVAHMETMAWPDDW
jgi:hypothetical protein